MHIDATATSLSELSDQDLLALWVETMTELRHREILRTDNSPTGDYGEWIVSKALNLSLEANSKAGYDAVGPDGTRYQIKARRLATPKTSRQLSALRHLDQDPFDFLIIVLFGTAFDVKECWQVPIEVVRKHAVYNPYVNAHRLHARGAILNDPKSIRLLAVEDW